MSLILHLLWPLLAVMPAFLIAQPDIDGGSGDHNPGVDGGGNPGTPTGSSVANAPAALPVGEHGGVFGSTYFLFVPVQDCNSGQCYIGTYDITDFNDLIDGSSYAYRREDIVKHKVPTVNRVIIIYRDLGPAKFTVGINATNDDGQVIKASVQVQIGNVVPTKALLTKIVDISLTGYMPQLTIDRAAGDGPLCITSATMQGEV